MSRGALAIFVLLAAAEPRRDEPSGWRIRQEGDRVEIFDRDSNRVGWGRQQPDGSIDLFRPDGSRLGTVLPGGPEGAPRAVLPERWKGVR